MTILSVFALLLASAACGLSLAVALRVKKILDPLTQEGALGRRTGDGPEAGDVLPSIPPLIDVNGETVTPPVAESEPWVLTFQAVGCSGCKEQLPGYKKFLNDMKLEKGRVISIVAGNPEGIPFYSDALGEMGHVIPDGESTSELMNDLGVSVFPTYLVVGEGGRIITATRSSARLSAGAAHVRASSLASR